VAAFAAGGCRKKESPPSAPPAEEGLTLLQRIDRSLGKAGSFLASQQDPDGSIRSKTYSALKDGWSLTTLTLASLRFVPQTPEVEKAYRRGADFIASLVDEKGQIATGPDGPKYAVYSIALAILVLNAPGNERHAKARDALIAILRRLQLTEQNGWQPSDPSYGGWGYYWDVPVKPDGPITDVLLPSNLTATLYAIGAIQLAGVPTDDPALVKALSFVKLFQNYSDNPAQRDEKYDDGGFFMAPDVPDDNKAGVAGTDRFGRTRYNSYGSMTADGLRALVRLGVDVEHARVQASADWLRARYTAARTPGVFPPQDEYRRESTYYYYAWSVAHALRLLAIAEIQTRAGKIAWAPVLAEEVLKRQRPDGTWHNRFTEGREDDPIVSTAFAIAALANARITLTGEQQSHAAQD
jgi:hypothetical protein